jgi:uncharacterized protein (UPF0276 family)
MSYLLQPFEIRRQKLPFLGLGVSTEYEAYLAKDALDLYQSRQEMPHCTAFLEIGLEVAKGLDAYSQRWISEQQPTICHFLDINLDEKEDFDQRWVKAFKAMIDQINPAWICGDAGLWHFGPRVEGQMLLLPPILSKDSAKELAEGICRLRELTQKEIIPENPPGHVFVGDMHLLDFFALVCDLADTGFLLDIAHLSIFQKLRGLTPITGLDGFPLDRIIEIHVAGGVNKSTADGSFHWIEDAHLPTLLPDSWEILSHIATDLTALKAIVFECERNPLAQCKPEMQRLHDFAKKNIPLFQRYLK